MDRLFDPFFRGEANQVRYVPGAGLGLSIVKQLVEAMGGEIIVDNKSGKARLRRSPYQSKSRRASAVEIETVERLAVDKEDAC